MARLARYVIRGIPHDVTKRGNGRQSTFFVEGDYAAHGVAVWSLVPMPNRVDLVLVLDHVDALRAALSEVHGAHTGCIHAREKRADMVQRAADWRWSRLNAQLDPECGDGITHTAPVLYREPNFAV